MRRNILEKEYIVLIKNSKIQLECNIVEKIYSGILLKR